MTTSASPLPIGDTIEFWRMNAGQFSVDCVQAGLAVLALAEIGVLGDFPPEILEKVPQAQLLTTIIHRHLERMGKKSSLIIGG